MPRVKDPTKPKRNVWKDQSPYGTFVGRRGTPDDWAWAFGTAMGRDEAEQVIGSGSAWDILGLQPGATQDEIKKAFRKLAMQWHPDRCRDKNEYNQYEAQFKAIRAAYELLKGD